MIIDGVVGARLGELLKLGYKTILVENRKIATRKTYEGIEYEVQVSSDEVKVLIFSNKSLVYIEKGRRKGAKLPVRKTSNGYELVFELQEWVDAVQYRGGYYFLARKIARDGIKGVPITDLVLKRLSQQIDEVILDFAVAGLREFMTKEVKSMFNGI